MVQPFTDPHAQMLEVLAGCGPSRCAAIILGLSKAGLLAYRVLTSVRDMAIFVHIEVLRHV